MRAVLDTVVFVRALINPRGLWGRLLFDLSAKYIAVLSPDIIREVLEVIHRPALRERFPPMADPPNLDRILALLEQAEVVEPEREVVICRDPSDDKFFSCAFAGRAQYIVSEDKDILDIGQFEGVKTVTAKQFIALLAHR